MQMKNKIKQETDNEWINGCKNAGSKTFAQT